MVLGSHTFIKVVNNSEFGVVESDKSVKVGSAKSVRIWAEPNFSAAERTAKILEGTGAKVICAFCNISNSHLSNIPEEIDCDCLIAGDDKESKEIAIELINKIPGIRTIDTGVLEKARIIEKITPLLIGLNIKYKSHYGGLRITGIPKLDE